MHLSTRKPWEMNGSKIFADTNSLIYLYDGNETVSEILNGKTVFISFITEIELLSKPNLTSVQINLLQELLKDFVIIDINKTIKETAASIRRENRIKLPEAIIAATAKHLSIPIVTADSDFQEIAGVDVLLLDL